MFNLLFVLALNPVASAAALEVTATRLDGTSFVGELQTWDKDHVTIATPHGDQQLNTGELLSLAWPPAPPKKLDASSTAGHVELTDGSIIPAEGITVTSTTATMTLLAALPSLEKSLTVPRRQVAAVRLQPLSAASAQHWQEIRDADYDSDVLILLKRGGKSLDHVEGVLGDVTPEKIEFKLDGEAVRIDRAKVAGFIYYRPKRLSEVEPRCIVQARSGLTANASQVAFDDGGVELTTVSGVEFRWPLDDLYLADFSAGKLVYLSDLEPSTERWTPLVGLPSGATLAAEYGRPRRNQSAYGGPLALRQQDALSAASGNRPRVFSKGLALRSRTELLYRLPAGFRRFTTIAGIDPSTTASGNVRLEIYGDDRLLLEDNIAGDEPPRSIELDISGVKRLKVLVDYGRNLDTGDWLNLCDARIVK